MKVSHEPPSPELDRFGYTCPVKNGNDQILEKIGITSLGMALTVSQFFKSFESRFKLQIKSRIFSFYVSIKKLFMDYKKKKKNVEVK